MMDFTVLSNEEYARYERIRRYLESLLAATPHKWLKEEIRELLS
jgi:hypothetical protein